jgi:hypothetical protein
MENYKTTTNCNPDQEEKMALVWPYPKETHWIHTEGGTRLEPSGGLKARPSQKDLEEGGRGRSHGSVSQMPYAPEGATGFR